MDDPGGVMKRGEMNEQLAVSVGEGTADPAAAGSAVAPWSRCSWTPLDADAGW